MRCYSRILRGLPQGHRRPQQLKAAWLAPKGATLAQFNAQRFFGHCPLLSAGCGGLVAGRDAVTGHWPGDYARGTDQACRVR